MESSSDIQGCLNPHDRVKLKKIGRMERSACIPHIHIQYKRSLQPKLLPVRYPWPLFGTQIKTNPVLPNRDLEPSLNHEKKGRKERGNTGQYEMQGCLRGNKDATFETTLLAVVLPKMLPSITRSPILASHKSRPTKSGKVIRSTFRVLFALIFDKTD